MRVTQSMLDRDLLCAINSNLDRLARLNEQISSGQRVNTISDDVPATGRILALTRENAQFDTYLSNIDIAGGHRHPRGKRVDGRISRKTIQK